MPVQPKARAFFTCTGYSARSQLAAFPGVSRRQFWEFDDPAKAEGTEEAGLASFREVRGRTSARIKARPR